MYIKEIVDVTEGKLLCGNTDNIVKGFTQDSRKCTEGYLYIPIIGKNNDGYDYIESAFSNGAIAILSEKELYYEGKCVILVSDVVKSLGKLANYERNKSNIRVVGVTGSVGKTSTKDMIYSVLSSKYKTLKTIGNYNNNIGLPLTILRHSNENVMVVEMGMNHLNEIDYLTKIAEPDVAVITNIGTAHIGELGSKENILKAKLEIVNGLKKDGILIVNNDDEMLSKYENNDITIKSIGIESEADLKAFDIINTSDSSKFKIKYNNNVYNVFVPIAGNHFVYNALIAILTGLTMDINIEDCIKGVRNFELTQNRADVIELKNNIRVYDGSYNANLDSMKSSIDVLGYAKGRKIAVLGDMLELGDYEKEIHKEVGKYLCDKDIDIVLAVGDLSVIITDEVKNNNKIGIHFNNKQELVKYLLEIIEPNDTILVKASNSIGLQEVVNRLKELK